MLWYFVFFFKRIKPLSSYKEPHDKLRCRKCVQRERERILRDMTKPAIDLPDEFNSGGGGGDDGKTTSGARVDCSVERRFCVSDNDCQILCKEYKRLLFRCNDTSNTCDPQKIFNDAADDNDERENEENRQDKQCDVKNGEFAMLVGYTTLGTAIWQCIQLYRHFRDRSKFCEGGTFDMRADIREPSYRDCECPPDTIRAVYRHPTAYEQIGDSALPHCISKLSWNLYRASMLDTLEEEEEREDSYGNEDDDIEQRGGGGDGSGDE